MKFISYNIGYLGLFLVENFSVITKSTLYLVQVIVLILFNL